MDDYEPGDLSKMLADPASVKPLNIHLLEPRKRKLSEVLLEEKESEKIEVPNKRIRLESNNGTEENGMGNDKDMTMGYKGKIRLSRQRKPLLSKKMVKEMKKEKKQFKQKLKEPTAKIELTPQEKREREELDRRTVFVGNIPDRWKETHIKEELFPDLKEHIEDIFLSNYLKAHRNRKEKSIYTSRLNRGHIDETTELTNASKQNMNCWVRFDNPKWVKIALEKNNTVVEGRFTIRVDYCDSNIARISDHCVFVGGLPVDATEDDLRQHFDNYCCKGNDESTCKIVNVRIVRDPKTFVSKKCGFIEFDNIFGVHRALDLHNTNFLGKTDSKKLRVLPYVKDFKKAKDDADKEVEHLKTALSAHPKMLKSSRGHVFARFEGDHGHVIATEDDDLNRIKKFRHKGRDKQMNKLRWRDHPELKIRSLARKTLQEAKRKPIGNNVTNNKSKHNNRRNNDEENDDDDNDNSSNKRKNKNKDKKLNAKNNSKNTIFDDLLKKKGAILTQQKEKINKIKYKKWIKMKQSRQ
ncbi:hypothetical protein RFI_09159 [Reticulomyxa filosa]|uniref:RRM domain-containing protein n=1 Tax=Reticulomyxa filosa TaxID=46433 RepID=X6NQK4_RETFI|nr:hypothetical protein RFI_09159 [Reticulomyxa filosa]|eukprot:ETO27974.1 hypothetical protein RFI_09159 [Reticulomyxa filosa]